MSRLLWIALLAGLAGCGGADTGEIELQPREYVVVRSEAGEEHKIPAGELANPPEETSGSRQVLAVDRETGQKTWVTVEKVIGESPVTARYIPVTETKEPPETAN